MMPTRQGALQLFRVFGIDVYLHWTWLILAVYEFQSRGGAYAYPVWNLVEFLGLFGIVLLHEFGHALACQQVGGKANYITLWPFGGVANVNAPQRPGAQLWCIAAGPLVNVVLAVLFYALFHWLEATGQTPSEGLDLWACVLAMQRLNLWLLLFNILPVYPLDGGQILRSLLWYVCGAARSLQIAAAVGFLGVAGLAWVAFRQGNYWLGFIAYMVFSNCQRAWRTSEALLKVEAAPRRTGVACPDCHAEAPQGSLWTCVRCAQPFDPFASFGTCPHCQAQYAEIWCLECGVWSTVDAWEGRRQSATVSH